MLESVCVLPQLLLLRQTTVPTVIDSFYLVTLGSYRAFYIMNWIVRGFQESESRKSSASGDYWISFIFGIVQTALYVDFAWVYWTRQRVKLRSGSVVDADDMNQGWLVKRIIGRRSGDFDDEEAPASQAALAGDGNRPNGNVQRWGPRGISVSADEGLNEVQSSQAAGHDRLADPTHFEDELSDDGNGGPDPAPAEEHQAGVSNGSEWRSDAAK